MRILISLLIFLSFFEVSYARQCRIPSSAILSDIGQESSVRTRSGLPSSADSRLPISITRRSESRGRVFTTRGATQIDASNIEEMFAYSYNPARGHRGAKALFHTDSEGVERFAMWSIGDEAGAHVDIHHRDVLSQMVRADSDRMLQRAVETGDDNLLRQSEVVEGLSSRITNVRTHESLRGFIANSQGYQMTAENVDGALKVTHIDLDSAITKAQITLGHTIDPKDVVDHFVAIYRSIDPSVRAIRSFRIINLERVEGLMDMGALRREMARRPEFSGDAIRIEEKFRH